MCFASSRNLSFLHRLQECGLCFGWRPIDFIRQKKIGKYRAPYELKVMSSCPFVFLDHVGPRDIRRHQIRCKLDTTEVHIERFRERTSHFRLAQSGNAMEQDVTSRKKSDEHRIDDLVLSHHNFRHLNADL